MLISFSSLLTVSDKYKAHPTAAVTTPLTTGFEGARPQDLSKEVEVGKTARWPAMGKAFT
jgi:hypothetical protein